MLAPWRWALDLTDPAWLWGLAALPLLAWWSRRGLVNQRIAQKRISLACRAAIVALLVLVLSGLTLRRPTREPFVVFAVDGSLSIGEEAAAVARDYLERRSSTESPPVRRFYASPRHLARSAPTQRPRSKRAPARTPGWEPTSRPPSRWPPVLSLPATPHGSCS